uniref:Uncharacterized protein n=1 Tax=Oryza punctata TaxID=4537 RepID=A0A0E0K4K4_ORYPU
MPPPPGLPDRSAPLFLGQPTHLRRPASPSLAPFEMNAYPQFMDPPPFTISVEPCLHMDDNA